MGEDLTGGWEATLELNVAENDNTTESMQIIAMDVAARHPTCARAWELLAKGETSPRSKLVLIQKGLEAQDIIDERLGESGIAGFQKAGILLRARLHRMAARAHERLGDFESAARSAMMIVEIEDWRDEITNEEALRLAFLAGDTEIAEAVISSGIIDASYHWMEIILPLTQGSTPSRKLIDATLHRLQGEALRGISLVVDPEYLQALAQKPTEDPEMAQVFGPALPLLQRSPKLCERLAEIVQEFRSGNRTIEEGERAAMPIDMLQHVSGIEGHGEIVGRVRYH